MCIFLLSNSPTLIFCTSSGKISILLFLKFVKNRDDSCGCLGNRDGSEGGYGRLEVSLVEEMVCGMIG